MKFSPHAYLVYLHGVFSVHSLQHEGSLSSWSPGITRSWVLIVVAGCFYITACRIKNPLNLHSSHNTILPSLRKWSQYEPFCMNLSESKERPQNIHESGIIYVVYVFTAMFPHMRSLCHHFVMNMIVFIRAGRSDGFSKLTYSTFAHVMHARFPAILNMTPILEKRTLPWRKNPGKKKKSSTNHMKA